MRRLVLLLLVIALLTAPPATARSGKPRPDLRVTAGSVALRGTTVHGSFTVKDRGRARARASVAALTVGGRPLAETRVGKLRPGRKRVVDVAAALPAGLPTGPQAVRVCADAHGAVRERSEVGNCRELGSVTLTPSTTPSTSSVPSDPIPFQADTVFRVAGGGTPYWLYVPASYDATHHTPTELLVWMHGCGGEAEGDAYLVSPGGDQDWISLSLGGRDGDCWDVDTDSAKVLAALADVETHFAIDPRRVVIGGYSSGGDLAYRTAFDHSQLFAGLVAENTSPFRDTGSDQASSLAAASWRFPVVHLAHTQDEVYPIAGVRSEVGAMDAAGFPATLIERPGTHGDDGTDADLRRYLLPALDAGWRAPTS